MTATILHLPDVRKAYDIYAALEREKLANPNLGNDAEHRRRRDTALARYLRIREQQDGGR